MDNKQKLFSTVESLFMKYGIKSITMDDVSKELGISKKTLYQYVENKKDLIDKVMQQNFANELRDIGEIHQNSKDAIDEMLQVSKHVTQQLREMHPSVVYDLQKYYRESWQEMEKFHEEFIYGQIKQNIERGQQEGLYRLDLDPDIIAKLYVSKTMVIVDESTFPLREYNRETLFLEYIFYHIRGIASLKGLKLLEKHH